MKKRRPEHVMGRIVGQINGGAELVSRVARDPAYREHVACNFFKQANPHLSPATADLAWQTLDARERAAWIDRMLEAAKKA